MEYCSAIKRNIFDSVVLSLMNIDEPIIYCEVSQREISHNITKILKKKNTQTNYTINLFAKQKDSQTLKKKIMVTKGERRGGGIN